MQEAQSIYDIYKEDIRDGSNAETWIKEKTRLKKSAYEIFVKPQVVVGQVVKTKALHIAALCGFLCSSQANDLEIDDEIVDENELSDLGEDDEVEVDE